VKKRLCQRLLTPERVDTAWQRVKANGGAPGTDGVSLDEFEADYTAQVAALVSDLRRGAYRCQGYRVVEMPKGDGTTRRLTIPTVRDRLLQTAAAMFITPKLERNFHDGSYAYRHGRGVQDALSRVAGHRKAGRATVLLADIHRFFDSVPHGPLFSLLDPVPGIRDFYPLLRQWLSAPLLTPEGPKPMTAGLPQGLPVSPLLANFYLTPFDDFIARAGYGLVRYADDMALCCRSREQALEAKDACRHALSWLGLTLNEEKTESADFQTGFSFLGARFQGEDVLPAQPHPYEASMKPPPKPQRPRRQGLPRRMLRTLYIQEQGSLLHRHGERFVLSHKSRQLLEIPVHQIDQIFAFGGVNFTTPAIVLALMRGIPIHLLSSRGRYYGEIHGSQQHHFDLRRRQFQVLDDHKARLAFAVRIVAAKVQNGIALLDRHRRNHPDDELEKTVRRLKQSVKRVYHAKGIDQLRGIEGAAAADYYQGFARCLRGDLSFNGRTRHPPTDPLNSLLSFGYTLLFHDLCAMLWAHGLDPHVGLFHEPGPRHPALASDLIEPFRAPVVDALVLALVNRRELTDADFRFEDGAPRACLLRDDGRVRFLRAFEQKLAVQRNHPDVGHPVDWRRIIDLQVARFRRWLLGQVDTYDSRFED